MCFNLADLFRINSSIQDITINAKHLFLNKYFWDAIHTSLHNPRRLYLARSSSEGSSEPVFWEVWRRFEEIEYTRRFDSCAEVYDAAVDGSVRLKSFKCDEKRYLSARTQGLWRWLRKCPNLTTLHWPYIRSDLEKFGMREFNKPVWPHLEDLSLEEMGRCDDEAARVFFGRLGPLTHLRMTRGFLGPHFFDLLRERHFDSLRTLCVENMSSITGEMVLGVLQHCAPLEVFETRRMSFLDLRANPGPWACLGLRRLRVALETDPADPEVDRMFFEQLSKLTNLKEFDTSRSPHDAWEGPQYPLLQLRLDRGLAQLSNLTRLWTVKIESTGQGLSSEDVEWMLEHWPLLTRLSGKLSSDTDIEERITDLPVEVLDIIGDYLDTGVNSFKPLILTSSKLYHHFSQRLWRHVTVHSHTPPDFFGILKDRTHFVHSIRFKGRVQTEYYLIHYPGLLVFEHDNTVRTIAKAKEVCRNSVNFFRLNPTIQDVIITPRDLSLNEGFWNAIFASLQNPRRLKLGKEDAVMKPVMEGGSGRAFWRVCGRFEQLHWGGLVPIGHVHEDVEPPVWPYLEDLRLGDVRGTDETMARVVFTHLPPSLKHLRVDSAIFGPESFGILRERVFDNLRTLSVRECTSFRSPMILEALQKCPRLEELDAYSITTTDLRGHPGTWACHGLTLLRVTFRSGRGEDEEFDDHDNNDGDDDHLLFKHISTLTHLEELDMTRYPEAYARNWFSPSRQTGPQLRLDSGLGQLLTLTRLKKAKFSGIVQNMRVVDVDWMLQSWPKLEELCGEFSQVASTEKELSALTSSRSPAPVALCAKPLPAASGTNSSSLHEEDYTIPFPALTSLSFGFLSWPTAFHGTVPPPDRNDYFASIIRLCPRIQNLTLTNAVHCPSVQLWETIFSTLENPRRLAVTRMDPTDNPSMQAFWKACSRFEELELIGFDILTTNELPATPFPRLKRLTHQLTPYFRHSIGQEGQLTWIMRCPNLTALEWRTSIARFPSRRLVEAIRQNTWPNLESFQLIGTKFKDDKSALILQHLPPLHVLRFPNRYLSELSFGRLQERHFASLSILDLNGCTLFTSEMVLSVLSGCPLLEDLSAPFLTASDLRQSEPARRAWVCLGLTRLKVYITRDREHPDADKLVFEQLSKLVKLEELDIGDDSLYDLNDDLVRDLGSRGALQLRLDSGLDCLAGMKSLYAVEFRGTVQTMRVQEIEWMLENWPELREVSGKLSKNSQTHAILKGIFEKRDICTFDR
ncbi:hypothetical protein KI688_010593 [Linnemannia hyalina]|uniref:F-box domain-containing protein n=1 Tax=Linnemannia hyalina TaxID=64524 RepID=A0A9P7XWB5_9FUNG|nr:hypothetical protein KI688_010593 [Linnemannia hyalina]